MKIWCAKSQRRRKTKNRLNLGGEREVGSKGESHTGEKKGTYGQNNRPAFAGGAPAKKRKKKGSLKKRRTGKEALKEFLPFLLKRLRRSGDR